MAPTMSKRPEGTSERPAGDSRPVLMRQAKETYMTAIVDRYQNEVTWLVDLFCEGKITEVQMMFVWYLMTLSIE